MKSKPELLEKVLDSLNPLKYKILRQHVLKNTFRHFLLIMAFGVLISGLIYIPQLFGFVNEVKTAYNTVDTLQLNPVIETSEPVEIGKLVIDTQQQRSPNASKYYVDNEFLYYKYGNKRKSLEDVGNVRGFVGTLISSLPAILIVLIPSFFVSFYVFAVVLFLVSILFMSLLLKTVSLNLKKEKRLPFGELLSIGFYASLFLGLALIASAIKTNFGLYFCGVFMIYFIIAALQKPEKHAKKMDELGD